MWLLLLFLPLFPSDGKQSYFIIIAWMFSIFVTFFNNSNAIIRIDKNEKKIAFAPMAMIVVWVYGLLVGIINHNPTNAIASNFAGTILYIFFYFLLCFYNIDIDHIKNTIVNTSILLTITILIIFFLINWNSSFHNIWPISNVDLRYMEGKSTNGIFIGGQSFVFVLVALTEWNLLSGIKKKKYLRPSHLIFFVLSSYATVLTNTQGGLKLAYLGTVALIFMSWLMRIFKHHKNRAKIYFTIIFLSIIVIGVFFVNYTIGGIIDAEDSGDKLRIEQIRIVLKDFNFFGHGLGNMIYEPMRGSMGSTGYGIEMSYANLLDKYGAFAVIQICVYFITITEGIIGLVKYGDEAYAIAIGLMGYLFIAAGNPVLFSPTNVVCHCLALFLIYKNNVDRRYNPKYLIQF